MTTQADPQAGRPAALPSHDAPPTPPVVPATSAPGGVRRFWPFKSSKLAFGLAPVLLVALLAGWSLVRTPLQLEQVSGGWLLLGIAVLAVLPVVMVVLDGLAASGGSIEVASVKVALVATAVAQPHPEVPSNVSRQPGLPVGDSGSVEVLAALEQSTRSDVVIVDLGSGDAWWETRLVMLCAGAARHGRPKTIVFVATISERPYMFVGWVRPDAARDRLLAADPRYSHAAQTAAGLASAARLKEAGPGVVSVDLPVNKAWMTRLPSDPIALNPFLDEQLLAAEMAPLETNPKPIGPTRLKELLDSVLHTRSVESAAADADWFRTALLQDEDVALTERGRYVAILPRHAIVTSILLALTGK